jgi:NAD(P)-dependent dehydrogenase (short-subunit alcohol dehydrogenase family)
MASILITGASKGIGYELARELSTRGHRVIATARRPETLADLDVDQRLALDVTDADSIAAAVGQAGEIDVFISNAAEIFYASVEEIPVDAFAQLLDINLLGALRVAQAVLPGMRRRGSGRLLFMSSVAGRLVSPPGSAYAATKWALEALGESLAKETAGFGISVGLLEPGAVSSGALDDVRRYQSLDGEPYGFLFEGSQRDFITVQQVATEIAQAVEAETIPLRIPIGDPARSILAARRAAPDDVPFPPAARRGAD